jgi:hypothetical protein
MADEMALAHARAFAGLTDPRPELVPPGSAVDSNRSRPSAERIALGQRSRLARQLQSLLPLLATERERLRLQKVMRSWRKDSLLRLASMAHQAAAAAAVAADGIGPTPRR